MSEQEFDLAEEIAKGNVEPVEEDVVEMSEEEAKHLGIIPDE